MARIARPAKPAAQEGLEHGLPLPDGAKVQKNGKIVKHGKELVVCAAGKHWHLASAKGCLPCGTTRRGGRRAKAAKPLERAFTEDENPRALRVAPPVTEKDLDTLAARAVGMARGPFPEEHRNEDMTDVQRAIWDECEALAEMLIAKNRAYGNSALDPVRIFSKAPPEEQIRVRLDDKLSRLMRGEAAGEDTEQDLLGYLVLLRVHRRAGR